MTVTTYPQRTGITASEVTVQPATGVAAIDTANIVAAMRDAGTGGVLRFPRSQTYVVGAKGLNVSAAAVAPALIDLNGSTIQRTSSVVQSTTAGTVSSGGTSIVLTAGGGALFAAGDTVILRDAYSAKNYTYATSVTAVSGDTLTVGAVSFANGTSVPAGALVQRDDKALYVRYAGSTTAVCRIINGTFDGQSTARLAASASQNWSYGELVKVNGGGYLSVIVEGCVFKNAEADALQMNDCPYTKVSRNHFENVYGAGAHPGGSGLMLDYFCEANTFKNCYQFTGATTPTVDQYGHAFQRGASCTSTGPKQASIINNIFDTSTGWGFGAVPSLTYNNYIISGNQFYNCDCGAFAIYGDGVTVSNNLIKNCGHETAYSAMTTVEVTSIQTINPAMVTISGNTFLDSVLNTVFDAGKVAITGNSFSTLNLTNSGTNTIVLAGLSLARSSTGPDSCVVSGNLFVGPTGGTTVLDGIKVGLGANIAITGNVISGHRYGIVMSSGVACNNVSISDNVLQDQCETNSGKTNAAAIALLQNAATNLVVDSNVMRCTAATTAVYQGIYVGNNSATWSNCRISGNAIRVSAAPASGALGMNFASNTGAGLVVQGNVCVMNSGGQTAYYGPSFTSGCFWLDNYVGAGAVNYGAASVLLKAIQAKTGNYTATVDDRYVKCDTTSAGFTVTLPSAPTTGQVIGIKKTSTDANTLTIARNSKNINGAAADLTTALTTQPAFELMYDGTGWWTM